MKKKKGIRYSDLAPTIGTPAPADPAPPVLPAVPVAAAVPAESPRPRRVSTPVELARALVAAQSAEQAAEAIGIQPRPDTALVAEVRGRHGPVQGVPEKAPTVDLLMFRVGKERFAVELLSVDEVIDLPVIYYVPEMPPAMLGVVAVRESLTPVYSPHEPLGVPLALREAVLIFRRGRERIGILIDDVDDAISVDVRELRNMQGAADDGAVLGVIRHDGVLVAIVDADALIAACQATTLQETA